MSRAIRQLVNRGRLVYAIDSYKKGNASLGKAAELAGVTISQMMDLFVEFGVESNIEFDDYKKGLENLRKIW